jgi:hypothetical protein
MCSEACCEQALRTGALARALRRKPTTTEVEALRATLVSEFLSF